MSRQQRDLKRERTWRRHIAEQRASGQTIRAYCDARQIRETSFYFWRTEIAKRDREAAAEPNTVPKTAAFVPVAVVASSTTASSAIDIRLASGHHLRVRAGCDCRLLAEVVAVLQARPETEGRPC
jgi:hypothetical protein